MEQFEEIWIWLQNLVANMYLFFLGEALDVQSTSGQIQVIIYSILWRFQS